MEMLLVISKVKKYIKEKSGMNTASSLPEALSSKLYQNIDNAIEHAKTNQRKTLMGRDFNWYVDNPEIDQILVVSSKVKKYIKEQSGLSTSSQVVEQLTLYVERMCNKAIENASNDKRKTVMDRDLDQE